MVRRTAPFTLAALVACGGDVRLGGARPVAVDAAGLGDASLEVGPGDAGAFDSDAGATADAGCNTRADCNGTAADGCETDTNTTAAHCGACGHDCRGSTCLGGLCQPVVLASGQSGPAELAVEGAFVFFLNNGAAGTPGDPNHIRRVSKDGGALVNIAQESGFPRAFATDGSHVYYTLALPQAVPSAVVQVRRHASDGTPGSVIPASRFDTLIGGIILDGADVVFGNGPELRTVPKTSTNSQGTVIASGLGEVGAVAADANAFFTVDISGGRILRTARSPLVTTTLLTGVTAPTRLALFGGALLVASGDRAVSLPLAGGPSESLMTGTTGLRGIAADASGVYLATGQAVMRTLGPGQPTALLASGFVQTGAVALDADFVYFTDVGAGIVYKLAK